MAENESTWGCSVCTGRVGSTYDSEHRGVQCVDCGTVFPVDGVEASLDNFVALVNALRARCPSCQAHPVLHIRPGYGEGPPLRLYFECLCLQQIVDGGAVGDDDGAMVDAISMIVKVWLTDHKEES